MVMLSGKLRKGHTMDDHERFMALVAKMPEPTDEQKRAIAEANTPEGWQRALDAVDADVRMPKRKVPIWSVVVWLGLIAATCLALGALQLIISN